MNILGIIRELRDTRSSTAKQNILKKYSSYNEWKDYLVEVYNPFITYGKSGDKVGGREDLENLKLCRSIDAGITAVTINKIYKGLIPEVGKIMKAKDKAVDKIKYPVIAEIKYDGHYTIIIRLDGNNRYFTSGGHEYTVRNNEPAISSDGVYLAERIGDEGKLGDRRKCMLKGSKQNGQLQYSEGHKFMIFDYMPLEEFNNNKTTQPFNIRRRKISECVDHDNRVESVLIPNRTVMETYMSSVLRRGYEGLVLKQPDMIWRNTRSRTLAFVKYKKRPSADLLCIEEIPGDTAKTAGVIGSLKLQDSAGRIVQVGSGMSDYDRERFGAYEGSVVEIEYEQLMDTYIQPTFICIREDKDIKDID